MNTVTDSKRPRARDIIDTATLIRIAAASYADPRTVDKVLLGRPVRGAVAGRILAVLESAGIQPLEPEQPEGVQ